MRGPLVYLQFGIETIILFSMATLNQRIPSMMTRSFSGVMVGKCVAQSALLGGSLELFVAETFRPGKLRRLRPKE